MKKAECIIQSVILLVFIYFANFYNLAAPVFQIWDESRLATNAYEMTQTGNWIVTTCGYEPDMWNTKPPLMIWAQALCINLNGINEFSTRFPAAFSAALTCLIVFFFVLKITKNGWAALTAATVVCTARGFIEDHSVRYGEYDAMLSLFTTGYLLAFFSYVEETVPAKKNKNLLLFFALVSLAVLTKGIAGLLFAPALFIYTLIRKHFSKLLSNKFFYLGTLGFLIIVVGYYLLRNHYNPGYIAAVYDNELGGRLLTEIEGHSGPPEFYFNRLKFGGFGSWFWLLPLSLVIFAFQPNIKAYRATLFAFVCSFFFILLLSLSQTKIFWYDMPAYPLFAIIIGITVLQISTILKSLLPPFPTKAILIAICIFISAQPVYEAYIIVNTPKNDLKKDDFYAISFYFRNAIATHKDLHNSIYLTTWYAWPWKLNAYPLIEQGKLTEHPFDGHNQFINGQSVIAHMPETKNYIESKFNYTVQDQFYNVRMYQILSKKNEAN